MEDNRKKACLQCERTFYPYPSNKVYCCLRCYYMKRDRELAERKRAMRGPRKETLQQRIEKRRFETERLRNYEIGDRVKFRHKFGVIIHKLEIGSSIPEAWAFVQSTNYELLPAANSTFASRTATNTIRFFIVCEEHGKKRVHCPMLHNIEEKPSDTENLSG